MVNAGYILIILLRKNDGRNVEKSIDWNALLKLKGIDEAEHSKTVIWKAFLAHVVWRKFQNLRKNDWLRVLGVDKSGGCHFLTISKGDDHRWLRGREISSTVNAIAAMDAQGLQLFASRWYRRLLVVGLTLDFLAFLEENLFELLFIV